MNIKIDKKVIIVFGIFGVLVTGFLLFRGYKEYKRNENAECYAWLLRDENTDVKLAPGDKCYQAQLDTREFINDYQPELK